MENENVTRDMPECEPCNMSNDELAYYSNNGDLKCREELKKRLRTVTQIHTEQMRHLNNLIASSFSDASDEQYEKHLFDDKYGI